MSCCLQLERRKPSLRNGDVGLSPGKETGAQCIGEGGKVNRGVGCLSAGGRGNGRRRVSHSAGEHDITS